MRSTRHPDTEKPTGWPARRLALAALAALLLLAAAWVLIDQVVLPWRYPDQMSGSLNVAVARIGVLGEDGRMRQSRLGDQLGTALLQALEADIQGDQDGGSMPDSIQVWHDGLGRDIKNVRLGFVDGGTPADRSGAAATLAARINADIVVYGFLTPDSSHQELRLEFFRSIPADAFEPLDTAGGQTFGAPIVISGDASGATSPEALAAVEAELQVKVRAFLSVTEATAYMQADEPERALAVLQAGERKLAGVPDEPLRGLFALFQGEAALYSRRYDDALTALDRSLAITPLNINAIMLKSSVYMDRGQLFFLRGRALTAEEQACISIDNLENSDRSLEDATASARAAVRLLEQTVALAPDSAWPPIEVYARLNLALAYRLLGQSLLFQSQLPEAKENLVRAAGEFERVLAQFEREQKPQYVGWTEAGLGVTRRYQAALSTVELSQADAAKQAQIAAQKRAESIDSLKLAISSYDACLAQREATIHNVTFQRQVLGCACEPYAREARTALASLQGSNTPPGPTESAPADAAQGEHP